MVRENICLRIHSLHHVCPHGVFAIEVSDAINSMSLVAMRHGLVAGNVEIKGVIHKNGIEEENIAWTRGRVAGTSAVGRTGRQMGGNGDGRRGISLSGLVVMRRRQHGVLWTRTEGRQFLVVVFAADIVVI